MTLLRMRIELPDLPGALAGATGALAGLGVDVVALDVLEVDGTTVVDELLMRLPPGLPVDHVADALRMAGVLEVLSCRDGGPVSDPALLALDLARTAVASGGTGTDTARALARVGYADEAAVLDAATARSYPLALRALETGVPTSGRAGADAAPLPLERGWVVWVAPAVEAPQRVVVVGRRLDVRFSATETARLRAFAGLLEQLHVLSPASPP